MQLCISRGRRFNTTPGDDGAVKYRYVFNGLTVVTSKTGAIVTAYWASDDPKQIEERRTWFASVVQKRKAAKQQHGSRSKAKTFERDDMLDMGT